MKLLLFLLIGLLAGYLAIYYKGQNTSDKMGGPISRAKTVWLGIAVFNYFIFSIWLLFFLSDSNPAYNMLIVIITLVLIRLLVQSILMFVFHSWKPPMGMGYNIFCVLVITLFGYKLLDPGVNRIDLTYYIICLFVLMIQLILVTDTLYAKRFLHIVGPKTTGRQAVWYAADAPEFADLNRLTAKMNIFFLALSVILITITFFKL